MRHAGKYLEQFRVTEGRGASKSASGIEGRYLIKIDKHSTIELWIVAKEHWTVALVRRKDRKPSDLEMETMKSLAFGGAACREILPSEQRAVDFASRWLASGEVDETQQHFFTMFD